MHVTVMDGVATGLTIVMFRVLTSPSAVRVKVAVPGPTPANNPVALTVKTLVFEEDQVVVVGAAVVPFE